MEASTLVHRAPIRECAMSTCREPASPVPLAVDLDYFGAVELPLCPMHVQEFEDGCDLAFVVAGSEEVSA